MDARPHQPPQVPHSIIFVHAHPDDETLNNGATMARYAAEGHRVTLVTCTCGEVGEILLPELGHLLADREDGLGGYRVGELAAAMKELGVTDHRFLGGTGRHRDSGMMGTPANDKPGTFWHADVELAAGELAEVIREVRPEVLVTYNEIGGYGHPDHIQAHRVAMRAVDLAADASFGPPSGPGPGPHQVAKIYWNAMPQSRLRAGLDAVRAAGSGTRFDALDVTADLPPSVDDALVTAVVDGEGFRAAKVAAMRAHATQITVEGPFYALSDNLGLEISAVEYYQQVRGPRGPVTDSGSPFGEVEQDLFAGLPAGLPDAG
jgi:N-acetyl-1-D-myo-inositol-2-amino-2-deoxy-alpha-D-glucopyranoside deacetylase